MSWFIKGGELKCMCGRELLGFDGILIGYGILGVVMVFGGYVIVDHVYVFRSLFYALIIFMVGVFFLWWVAAVIYWLVFRFFINLK